MENSSVECEDVELNIAAPIVKKKKEPKEVNLVKGNKQFEKLKSYFINKNTKFEIVSPYGYYEEGNNQPEESSGEYGIKCIITIGNSYNSTQLSRIERNFRLSCGYRLFSNLPFESRMNHWRLYIKPEYHNTFFEEMYRELFTLRCKDLRCARFMASTCITGNYKSIIRIFNAIAFQKTKLVLNPNSGNNIRTWYL